jgi:hypothetical protein
MAQSYTGTFGTLIKPSSVVDVQVRQSNSGVATTGVLMLVGEADAGPDVTLDSTLVTNNFYGPDQLGAVLAKYKSGPIVDAFKLAVAASSDPQITGSFTRAYIVKTNTPSKASASLTRAGLTAWGTAADDAWGALGNLTNVTVTSAQAEVAPTTGAFTWIPFGSAGASSIGLRVNGGATQTLALAASTTPTVVAGQLNALSGVYATGGLNRSVITTITGTLALTGTTGQIVITNSGTWANTPSVGDTLTITSTSVLGSGAVNNRGSYVVTAVSSSSISATKLADATSGGATNVTTVVTSTSIVATGDVLCYSPITLNNATGTARPVLTGLVGQGVTGTASGQSLTLTLATTQLWAATPAVGDLLQIASNAPAGWTPATNAGWYRVTASGSSVLAGGSFITMTRLSDGTPVSFASANVALTTDLVCLRPDIDGTGKTLEVFALSGVTPQLQLFNLSATPVTWISVSGAPFLLTSASEYKALVSSARSTDNISESFSGDPAVVLAVGYNGSGLSTSITGSMTISGTTLTTTVTGGTGSNLTINLKNYRTINDLVGYINSQTGYTASVASSLYGQTALNFTDNNNVAQVVLDKGTWGIASHLSASPGRVKKAAYSLWTTIDQSSFLIFISQAGSVLSLPPASGQPEAQALVFLSGGARGGSSTTQVTAAIDQLEKVRGNFLVTLFSRDSTADITDALTDASSTYLVDSINAYVKTHVLAMSQVKRRRHRLGFVSKKASFTSVKLAAANLASQRVSMCFQDIKAANSQGVLTQMQPWGLAVVAASMQAAGFYKPIVNKFMNVSGVLMADGSYSDQILSQVEDALSNGLLPAEQADTGGYRWVSDQTTYGVDGNFVYNSIQAMYVADTIALTLASRVERAFVGQSLADVGAGVILAFVQGVLSDLKRLKLIASSDGAPAGYRNATVAINGPVAQVSVEIYEATGLYFIPITTIVNQVQQSAAQ